MKGLGEHALSIKSDINKTQTSSLLQTFRDIYALSMKALLVYLVRHLIAT